MLVSPARIGWIPVAVLWSETRHSLLSYLGIFLRTLLYFLNFGQPCHSTGFPAIIAFSSNLIHSLPSYVFMAPAWLPKTKMCLCFDHIYLPHIYHIFTTHIYQKCLAKVEQKYFPRTMSSLKTLHGCGGERSKGVDGSFWSSRLASHLTPALTPGGKCPSSHPPRLMLSRTHLDTVSAKKEHSVENSTTLTKSAKRKITSEKRRLGGNPTQMS